MKYSVILLLALFIVLPILCWGQEYFGTELDEFFEEDFIVTARKTVEKVSDIPASVVIIRREDIEIYGYMTLTEILESIPGLYATVDYCRGGANFGVRGFWSGTENDNMLILVNGIHQVYDIESNYPLTKIAVPVEAIDRVEVVRGPMSVVYGSGAFFGVINIITNQAAEEEFMSILSGSAGSHKSYKMFARVAGSEGDFHYVFTGSLYDSEGIDEPLSKMVDNPDSTLPAVGVPPDYETGGRLEDNEKYFNFTGNFVAKSTRSLSRKGTRVSRLWAMLSLSSTIKSPCRNVFASK